MSFFAFSVMGNLSIFLFLLLLLQLSLVEVVGGVEEVKTYEFKYVYYNIYY